MFLSSWQTDGFWVGFYLQNLVFFVASLDHRTTMPLLAESCLLKLGQLESMQGFTPKVLLSNIIVNFNIVC